jgi:hypothetical protein
VRSGAIELKVYLADSQRRHVPHFHVWIGGESVASVRIVDRQPFIGGPLRRDVRRLIDSHLDDLADAWDEFNG